MIITFVRHAEVEEAYIGKYNGHRDISLSKKGELQAIKLAKKLQNESFDTIYCSDLLRARQTLAPLKHSLEVIYTKALREKSWGIHEGKSFQEIQDSGIYYENFQQWITALDGEDINTYKNNVKSFFTNIVLQEEVNSILIVTHSGLIKTFLSIMQNTPLEVAFNITLKYTDIVKFDVNNTKIL
ncbi:histidine phosphatase family protein [Sulfurimonas sp. SAG-AH-194-I05]|nr:histidine phosphatase family protein [Sulfurimonas sp. SAG-AH-194-I05]MDF1875253.1 histidine phosphatase family protein [Sulfurimonas sp. SAG-AH-194-I05]